MVGFPIDELALIEKRSSEKKEIPVYKLFWRDMCDISPILAWVALVTFVFFASAVIAGIYSCIKKACDAEGLEEVFPACVFLAYGICVLGFLFWVGLKKFQWVDEETSKKRKRQ